MLCAYSKPLNCSVQERENPAMKVAVLLSSRERHVATEIDYFDAPNVFERQIDDMQICHHPVNNLYRR